MTLRTPPSGCRRESESPNQGVNERAAAIFTSVRRRGLAPDAGPRAAPMSALTSAPFSAAGSTASTCARRERLVRHPARRRARPLRDDELLELRLDGDDSIDQGRRSRRRTPRTPL